MARYGFLLVFLAGLPAWPQPCEPAPALQEALHDSAGKNGEERLAMARELREKFPSDYFAHEHYQNVNEEGMVYPAAVRDEYRALRDAHPEDPLYVALYARALTGTTTPEAIEVLGRALELQPNYPPALLQLAYIYDSRAFSDAAKVRSNLEAYWKACPTSTRGYNYVARTADAEFIRESAIRLRTLADRPFTGDTLPPYSILWTLEFKATPLAEQHPVREGIRKDVARLRALDMDKYPEAHGEIAEAYKLLGDAQGTKWVDTHWPAGPASGSAVQQAVSQWRSSHPMKPNDRQYQDSYVSQTAEWIRQWPEDAYAHMERFNALRADPDAALEDRVAAAEEWLKAYEAHPSGPSPYVQIAGFYSSVNMRYAQLPGLLEKGLNDVHDPAANDLYPLPSFAARMSRLSGKWSAWQTAASAYIKLRRYDDARKLLAQWGASLRENRPPDDASDNDKRQHQMWDRPYWDAMVKLAQAENRKLDALVYLRDAEISNPPLQPQSGGQSYYTWQARSLWKDLGGSDGAFDEWMSPAAGNPAPSVPAVHPAVVSTAQSWTQINKPLPEFHFADMRGRKWNLDSFTGKATLVNLWATWCGPCREELPYLEKVFEKVRERKDIQVVTFNMDDNPGMIAPFLTEHKYTFPVVSAKEYVDKFLNEVSIPRNWIVDSSGMLRSERIGFGNGEDKWVDDVIASLEKAAPAAAK
jgi:thiol-disulfide isomerase/thioredoxin